LLRLRKEIGPIVGANLDPSHLFWMGADPLAAVDALGDAIHHAHAKDTALNEVALSLAGRPEPLDTRRSRIGLGTSSPWATAAATNGGGRFATVSG
jgi:sugar phosphate isomerase/epimerase